MLIGLFFLNEASERNIIQKNAFIQKSSERRANKDIHVYVDTFIHIVFT